MSVFSTKNRNILYFLAATVCIFCQHSTAVQVYLTPGSSKIVSVYQSKNVEIVYRNIPADVVALMWQVHSHTWNVTLSLQSSVSASSSMDGRNMGVVLRLKDSQTQASVFIFSDVKSHTTDALVQVTPLYKNDPIPGGCNEEFKFEMSPYINLRYDNSKTAVMYQWSNHGNGWSSCENKSIPLTYDLYVYYVTENDFTQETLFDGIKKMMSVDDITKHGRKIVSLYNTKNNMHSLWKVASYTGQGVVYNIIVKDKVGGKVTMAPYVPVATYTCDLQHQESSCSVGIAAKVIGTCGGLIGLFLAFLGHRFFRTATFIMASMAFGLVFFILLTRFTTESLTVVFVLGLLMGMAFGILWLLLWWTCGVHALTVLLSGIVGGYIIASVIFYSPMGNLEYWSRQFNYGIAFTIGVLIVPTIFLYFTKTLSILATAFVGSYLAVLSIDLWIHSGVRNIVVNSLRHATQSEFINDPVIVTGPFLIPDILLICTWGILFIAGTVFQVIHNKGKPDFPETRSRSQRNQLPWRQQVDEERQPLMPENSPQLYSENRPNTQRVNATLGELT